jgi:hypothetical protein
MTELFEIKARAKEVKNHFERFSDYWSKRQKSINAMCCQHQVDLMDYILGIKQKTWRADLFRDKS